MVAVTSSRSKRVNDAAVESHRDRRLFEQLTATFPTRRIRLEQGSRPVSARLIDLFSPLGFGSRALVVAPPKTGKRTLIREAAEAVLKGYPDAVVMAVLVGERPEEVTDLRARLEPHGGQVYAASFDEETERHAWLVQVAVERAKRVAESGKCLHGARLADTPGPRRESRHAARAYALWRYRRPGARYRTARIRRGAQSGRGWQHDDSGDVSGGDRQPSG